tara:strand:+ start:12398 stop:13138 length:741 start_codon:yes stop_codon:yes gene_type:complete
MIIIRYREIGTKGKNRIDFERQLRKNVKSCLKRNKVPHTEVKRKRGRTFVYTESECPKLKDVFGISSFSYAKEYEQDLQVIKEEALKLYKEGKTFRVTCQRGQKVLMPSTELAREVGAYIIEHTKAKVDLHNPEQTIYIELFNNKSYIYSEKIPGPGGLPLGTEGHAYLLLQNKDSIKAGLKVMRRGCRIDVVKEKDIDYSELKEYDYGSIIQEFDTLPEDAEAVIVSDTINNLRDYPYFVLRPLL